MTSEQLREERIARLPKGSKPGNRINRITHLSNAKFMGMLLQKDGATFQEIANETGLNRKVLHQYIDALRAEGLAYIHHYEEDALGRMSVKSFAIGNKPDAKRPPARTNRERAQDSRDRRRVAKVLGIIRQQPMMEPA